MTFDFKFINKVFVSNYKLRNICHIGKPCYKILEIEAESLKTIFGFEERFNNTIQDFAWYRS